MGTVVKGDPQIGESLFMLEQLRKMQKNKNTAQKIDKAHAWNAEHLDTLSRKTRLNCSTALRSMLLAAMVWLSRRLVVGDSFVFCGMG